MEHQKRLDSAFKGVIEYFQTSGFEYLALDCAGSSIRLSREQPSNVGGLLHETRESAAVDERFAAAPILASTVGFVDFPPGRDRFFEAGEHVAEGDCLFAIRRFRNMVEVRAAAAGSLASLLVRKGDFVEFGQPLATIC
jgi:biotin carboxyl carrier protein